MLGVDWSSLSHAVAFVVGMLVGGVAMARVTKMVMDYLRNDKGPGPEE